MLIGCRHPVWDTSLFRFLSLRVKGDERRYYINIQTESLDPIELWQHRLFLRNPGEWETVLIPWADFLRTRNGRISYKKFDGMDRERVKTVGASLIERKEGPFELFISEIKVCNTLPPGKKKPNILNLKLNKYVLLVLFRGFVLISGSR
jgi:NADH dehydrogenase [ubiquinone] 1 alpha subcomplex assembly factor 1